MEGFGSTNEQSLSLSNAATTLLSLKHFATTDVLCGRGRGVLNHAGNIMLRSHVKQLLPTYNKSDDKSKKEIQIQVYEQVIACGQFLIKKDSQFVPLPKSDALKKIAQLFRTQRKQQRTQSLLINDEKQNHPPPNYSNNSSKVLIDKNAIASLDDGKKIIDYMNNHFLCVDTNIIANLKTRSEIDEYFENVERQSIRTAQVKVENEVEQPNNTFETQKEKELYQAFNSIPPVDKSDASGDDQNENSFVLPCLQRFKRPFFL